MTNYTLKINPQNSTNGRVMVEATIVDSSERPVHSDCINLRTHCKRKSFATSAAQKLTPSEKPVEALVSKIEQDLLDAKCKVEEETQTLVKPKSMVPDTVLILGTDAEHRIHLFDRDRREMWIISRLRDLDLPTWTLIGGEWIARNTNESDMPGVRKEIALVARTRPPIVAQPWGQGIHRLNDGRLLVLNGNAALSVKAGETLGNICIKKVDDPTIDERLLQLVPGRRWCDLDRVVSHMRGMTRDSALETWHAVTAALEPWPFAHPEDQYVVAGLILATPIQACLAMRPLVWVSGRTNSGKTALLTLLHRMFPWATLFDNETSEAGLRQKIGNDVLPVMLDEFELSRHRRAIVRMLRTATRGGKIVKGTVSHRATEFGLRHIVWLSSIERGLHLGRDRNRYVQIELRGDGRSIRLPESRELASLGERVLALSLCLASDIERRAARVGRLRIQHVDARLTECYGLAVAAWGAVQDVTDTETEEYLGAVLEGRADVEADTSSADERLLMEAILTATLRIDVDDSWDCSNSKVRYREMSIAQIIDDPDCAGGDIALQAHGLKVCDSNGRAGLFIYPRPVCRDLLRNTMWGDLNIIDILLRIPAAKRGNRRLGGQQSKGVWVPLSGAKSECDETEPSA